MSQNVTGYMSKTKETKNFVRYDSRGSRVVATPTIYVRKNAVAVLGNPDVIFVTVEDVKEAEK